MENIDLNIDNYDYEDILNLFKLDINFGENDLKQAKKIVLSTHPDKSGLNKEIFLFFSKAYKILYSVYNFREKANKSEKIKSLEDIEYIADEDIYNKEIIENLKEKNKFSNKEFNKWFNELFEKVKIENDYQDNGYGDWLKKGKNNNEDCKNLDDMNNKILRQKELLRSRQLTKHRNIEEFNNTGFCDLTNSKPEEYSSGLFSNLQFEDLRKAHEESIVPVSNKDFKQNYNSLEDIRYKRGIQTIKPLEEKVSLQMLNENEYNETFLSSHRAYKLLQQENKIEKANKMWWSSLKQLQ